MGWRRLLCIAGAAALLWPFEAGAQSVSQWPDHPVRLLVTVGAGGAAAAGLGGTLGAVLGGMMCTDMGGPVNKVAYAFGVGLLSSKTYAPMAAIMSTINAQLLQSSATIIKDLYLNIRPEQLQNETRLKRMSAMITLILGALLLLAAWKPPEMIIWLNLLAFGGLEAVFLWSLVLGLYWERANATGALSAMIVGGVLYAILATFNVQYLGFHPIVPSLLISLLAFLIGNRFGSAVPQAAILTTDK